MLYEVITHPLDGNRAAAGADIPQQRAGRGGERAQRDRAHLSLGSLPVVTDGIIGSALTLSYQAGRITSYNVCYTKLLRLARAMTWKNAAAGLPHGGGKATPGGPR